MIQISWYPFPYISVQFVYYGEGISDDIELNSDNTELNLTQINFVAPQMKVRLHRSTTSIIPNVTEMIEYYGDLKEPFIQGRTDS